MKHSRKIYCMNNISEAGLSHFRKGYEITDDLDSAAGILVRSADMTEMEFSDEVRAIARAGAGVNNIPLERCAEEGIVVFNTPGANANSVKELVLTGMLMASRNVLDAAAWVKDNTDDPDIKKNAEKAKKAFSGHEISGKKLGVIGLGAIGVLVANAAVELGMEVYGYDPYLSVGSAWHLSPQVHYAPQLEDVCKVADYITIHVPFMPSTKGMIGEEQISYMHEGAVFMNFARDALVDEAAMSAALENGKIRMYVTDFPNTVSAKMKNAVVLPHIGASTEEAEENCAVMAVKELQDYIDNGNITHSVNYPDLNAGICQTAARVAILHRNIPNVISQITAFFGNNGLNIENIVSKSRDAYEYTIIDISSQMPYDTEESLSKIDGVIRVRQFCDTDPRDGKAGL